jgi:hypothetical protein
MPPHQFAGNFAQDIVDIEATGFTRTSVHDYQQQKIAEFLAKMRRLSRAQPPRPRKPLQLQPAAAIHSFAPGPTDNRRARGVCDDTAQMRKVIRDL